ncbi:MAG: polyprenyl synthetase family protein [Blastocatellia bacterium]
MPNQLPDFIAHHRPALEAALDRWLPLSLQRGAERLNEALRYAVFSGGKRLRPMLTLIGASLVGCDAEDSLPASCAVEFLHTSSLILDDLPAMDDADLRRGRPTLHLVLGEGVAVLAALALLNQSYALFALTARRRSKPGQVERLIAEAVECIGADGMIGGQVADLELRAASAAPDAFASRNLKTTALMRLTMTAGAMACGAGEADTAALARFGECLGLAYQACDDLIDEIGENALAGKTVGQDARHLRPTFVTELGIEGARRLALKLAGEGKAAIIERFGQCYETQLLAEVLDSVIREVEKFELMADAA